MSENAFDKLTAFLNDLEREEISYTLAHNRDEAIMVNVAIPGERWEVEFLDDGTIEVERFLSTGQIYGEKSLSEFFARYAEAETETIKETEVLTAV